MGRAVASELSTGAAGTPGNLFGRLSASGLVGLLAAAAFVLILAIGLRLGAQSMFDLPLTSALNRFAQRSGAVDRALVNLMNLHSFKGLAIVALAYGAFLSAASNRDRMALFGGCAGAAVAALGSRASQSFLPPLPRPEVDPGLPFRTPIGMENDPIGEWSAFPSDTSALLFGMAVAILLVSRKWGLVALAIACVAGVVRIYCGRHYPSDILAGAAVGAALALVGAALAARIRLSDGVLGLIVRYRAAAAALAFFASAQLALQFEDPRHVVAGVAKALLGRL